MLFSRASRLTKEKARHSSGALTSRCSMIPTISPTIAAGKMEASTKPPYVRATLIAILFLLIVVGLLFYPQITQLFGFRATEKGETGNVRPIAVTTALAATCEWQPTLEAIGSVMATNGVT